MSFQLFDRLGAYFRRLNVYRQQNLYTDQVSLDRIVSGGEFISASQTLQATNLQINRMQRYVDYEQMDNGMGEITLALNIYADETSLIDPEIKHNIIIKAKKKHVREELEDFFYNTLLTDNQLRPLSRYLCKIGDYAAEIVPTRNRDGVASLRFMSMYNLTRIETKHGDLIGYFFQDQVTMKPQFMHPWQVMHMRLANFESKFMPYGISLLEGARKHYKQLRLMEDAAIIYRLERAPEKRVFTVPVGNIPAAEVPQYIELLARQFKKKQFFDPSSGEVNERYWPLLQNDDIWLPARADGTAPTVTQMKGADNLGEITDVEYFKKKMVTSLVIPFSRVGIGDRSGDDSKPLAAMSPEFAKAVQWIQREISMGLKKVALVHLALRGFSGEDMREFDICMTASSAIDELYRIEAWASRAEVMQTLKAMQIFPDEWIVERFTNLTRDEIKDLKAEQLKAAQSQVGGMPGVPPPPGGAGMGAGPAGADLGGLPMPQPGLPGMGAAPGMPPMEGLDQAKEREMIIELAKFVKNMHTDSTPEQRYGNSALDYLINANELDGLSTLNEELVGFADLGPERENAKKQHEATLIEESVEPLSDEIRPEDLPTV